MKKTGDEGNEISDKIRVLGNPYAWLYYRQPLDKAGPAISVEKSIKLKGQSGSNLSDNDLQLGLFDKPESTSPTQAVSRKAFPGIKLPAHPYVILSEIDGENEKSSPQVSKYIQAEQREKSKKISKDLFRKRCRDIFKQYIPTDESRSLNEFHREFITRNESCTPEERHLLVAELMKYDISSSGGYIAHFNRENNIFSEEKLREIERKILR